MSLRPGLHALALAGAVLAALAAAWVLWPPAPAPTPGAPALPSGQQVRLMEALWDAQPGGETWLRLRYLAPAIAAGPGEVGFEAAADDMLFLCRRDGLGMLRESRRAVALIVVSLSDRELEFGASNPGAMQYFEAFRPQEGDCIWEEF